jgi:hypothetical protein
MEVKAVLRIAYSNKKIDWWHCRVEIVSVVHPRSLGSDLGTDKKHFLFCLCHI